MTILFPDRPNCNAAIFLLFFFCMFLWGCGQAADPDAKPDAKKDASLLPNDHQILAYVNKSPISGYDLEQSIVDTVGRNVASKLDPETRRTILKGLVSRRAIAQAQEKELDDLERQALEKQLQAHKETLLVKLYLAKNQVLEDVGEEQVKKYYQQHAQQFGARQSLQYEMILAKDAMGSAKTREKIMAALKDAAKKPAWSTWVADLKKEGLPVEYRKGRGSKKLLEPKLGELLDTMDAHQTSALHFIKGDAYMLRLTEKKQIPPRPLLEVRAQIREILRPLLFKQAIQKVSQQVLERSEIQYTQEI